jgi:hypothetical protein
MIIQIGNGNLGRAARTADGISALIVSGIAVAGKFALGDVLGPLRSVKDAEALGIDAAYDSDNKLLAHHHISDFYDKGANDGNELYVMVVADTVTMADVCDKTNDYAKLLLETLQGKVKLLGITRVPDGTYAAAATNQFDPDVWSAITNAKALIAEEAEAHRPVQVLIEGRDFQGTASSAKDLRASDGPDANRVSVVCSADNDVSIAETEYAAYAHVGYVLGRLAAIPVQRNIGRVKDGPMSILEPGLSNGAKLSTFTLTEIEALHDLGYILMRSYDNRPGYYFTDDPTACPVDDDYASIHRGRPIDKATRLARTVFEGELLDDVEVDPDTGKLEVAVVKGYQQKTEKYIEVNMLNYGEISGVRCVVDPDQDILSTDQVEINLAIVPKGMTREFLVKLNYENPSS